MNTRAEASEQKAEAIVPCTRLHSCAPGPRQPRRSNLWIVARLLPKTRKRAFIVGKMQASGGIGKAQVTPPTVMAFAYRDARNRRQGCRPMQAWMGDGDALLLPRQAAEIFVFGNRPILGVWKSREREDLVRAASFAIPPR